MAAKHQKGTKAPPVPQRQSERNKKDKAEEPAAEDGDGDGIEVIRRYIAPVIGDDELVNHALDAFAELDDELRASCVNIAKTAVAMQETELREQLIRASDIRADNLAHDNDLPSDARYDALKSEWDLRQATQANLAAQAWRIGAFMDIVREHLDDEVQAIVEQVDASANLQERSNRERLEVLEGQMQQMPGRNPQKTYWDEMAGGFPEKDKHRRLQQIQERHNQQRLANLEARQEIKTAGLTSKKQGPETEPTTNYAWQFLRVLSEETMSCTISLWAKLDHRDRIIGRVVRKETYLGTQSWLAPTRWADNQNMLDAEKVPWEWQCHKDLADRPEARFVVEPVAYATDFETLSYRMYTAFCPHETLDELMKNHAKFHETPIPEPMLWYLLECFAQTGLVMQRGHIDEDQRGGQENWREIVHRDIKPRNVFLDSAGAGKSFPQWPTPKLGDFGLAFQTTKKHLLNPLAWNLAVGTAGYLAPEQNRFIDKEGHFVDDWPLLAHTNVWAFGMVLRNLMHLQPLRHMQYTGVREDHPTEYEPEFSEVVRSQYSIELVRCVQECVRFDAFNRPTFEQILQRIKDFCGEDASPDDENAPGMLVHVADVQTYVGNARKGDQTTAQLSFMILTNHLVEDVLPWMHADRIRV